MTLWGRCPNCREGFERHPKTTVFCSARCRHTAAMVRALRRERILRDAGGRPTALRHFAQEETFALVLEATYGGRLWHMTSKVEREAVRAAHGICENCGDTADMAFTRVGMEISPANLIVLCEGCAELHRPAPSPDEQVVLAPIIDRANAPRPMRRCDDPAWAASSD